MYDRGSSQLADRMGEGTFFGQGVGVIEKETQPSCTRVFRVPPPGGTPGTGTPECGKWLVASDWGVVKFFYHPVEAQQAFRLLSMHTHCYLAYVLEEA